MKYTLNLASGTYIHRRRLYLGAVVLAIFLFLLLAVNTTTIFRDLRRSSDLSLRLKELGGQSRTIQSATISNADSMALAQQIELSNQLLIRDNYRWTNLLDQLENHLADGISIRALQPDYKSGVLKLSGVAGTVANLQTFIDNLSRSTVFTHVYLKDQKSLKSKDGLIEGVSFSIELKRRGGHAS